MRVHEYAKQLNLSSKEVLQFLSDNNLSVKSHMSVLGDDVILMLDKNFKNEKTKMESQVMKRTLQMIQTIYSNMMSMLK